jgi:two-component system response regulator RegX3
VIRPRIVVAEDDPLTAKVMRLVFEDEGYEAITCTYGKQVVHEVQAHESQLVILSTRLPDASGFDLLGQLRLQGYRGPVVFMARNPELAEKLECFRVGADDFIAKPFEPLELVARVGSVLRRFQFYDVESRGTMLRVADAELSIGELTYRSALVEPTELSPTEMRILECLMRNARIVISRERLIERVWGFEMDAGTNRVDQYVRRVRRKIGDLAERPRYLHTVRGVGYVFHPERDKPTSGAAEVAA